MSEKPFERWPEYNEQSWSERFAELDRRHTEQTNRMWREIARYGRIVGPQDGATPMTDNTQKTDCCKGFERSDGAMMHSDDCRAGLKSRLVLAAALSQPPEASEVEADYGWVMYGPDGNWHWSKKKDLHECIEDQRPATPLEKCLFNAVGNSTENLTSYPPKASPVQDDPYLRHSIRMGARYLMQLADAGRLSEDEIVRVIMDRIAK